MKINVTRDNVVIDKNSIKPHENEYNITQCHFTFDDFIDSFQVKRVIFTVESTGEMYENDILDYECEIPSEVLEHEYETIKIGVYGYNIGENEELINRFSPSYDTFVVPTGSYKEGALSPEPITPSQYDIYSSKLQEGLDDVAEALEEVSHVDIDAEQLEHGASVTITNRNNEPKTVVINDGYTPVKGVDYFTTSEIEEIENTVKTDVINELDFDNTVNDIKQDIQDLNTNKASKTELEEEITARELADTNLQGQIDAISSSKDVVDIVGTYSDLQNYDTSTLTEEDVIKVLDDSTHNDAMSYYRWSNNTWNYIGSEGPFYTKSETNDRLNTKQAKIDSEHKLSSDLVDDTNQTHKFTSTNEKNTWNAKYDKPSNGIPKSDLVASVQESLNKADTAIQDVSNKEDKSNKVTEINSSSTDTQYPSAKCVYNSQKEQNEHIAELEMLYNAFPTVSAENETIQLDNTAKVKFREIDLKGNTSQVVIPEEQGTSVSNTSISISDVNTDKENTIEMSGNTYQKSSILPSEYTQVDYIQSTGNQYIDTGITADKNLRVEMNTSFINPSSANQTFGAIKTGSPNIRYHILCGNQKIALWLNDSTYVVGDLDSDKHYYDINPLGSYAKFDNTTITIPSNIGDTTLNFWLFGRNSTGSVYMCAMKLWTCKMYYNNVLVRDFIPCYRNSDNVIGLYDIVNNVFYPNNSSSTIAFTYGSVVSIPNPDYPQNIEVVTGTQNITIANGDNTQSTTYQVNLGNIELCKISTYQDRIYKQNDKWYLEKNVGKFIFNNVAVNAVNGNQSSSTHQSYNGTYSVINNNISSFISNKIMVNSITKYEYNSIITDNMTAQTYMNDNTMCMRQNTNDRIYFKNSAFIGKTGGEISSLINGNKLYYVLTTPTTTEITDTTLVNQLNALYNATIYPITNINTDTSNLLPYIDLHYNFVTPSPSPSRPSVVNVVKGNNTITISNSDNTETQNHPINLGDMELCKIGTYQDYIYESNGNWFKKGNISKITLNGSENWLVAGLGYACTSINDYSRSNNVPYCNLYLGVSNVSNTNSMLENQIAFNNDERYPRLYIMNYSISGVDNFKTWLSVHNTTVYYALATPTDTQITDTTLITQLDNIKKAYSYDTQTNISQTNTDKPFIIYAEAIRSLKDVFE